MAAPPPRFLSQLDVNDPQRANDCGETAEAMILQAGGVNLWPLDVVQVLGHGGVTDEQELRAILVARFPEVYSGSDWGPFSAAVARGDVHALTLIKDDNNADPAYNGKNRHWLDTFAVVGSGFRCANPWPDNRGRGRDVTYPGGQLQSAFVWGCAVAIRQVTTVGTTIPTGGTIVEENELDAKQAEMLQQIFNRTTELDSMAQRLLEVHNELTALHSLEDRVLIIQQDVAAIKAKP